MNLTESELKPYLGGRLEIKNRGKKDSISYGGIKNLCITEGTLKIELIWAIEFQSKYDGFEQSKFVHTPEIKEYSINLESCEIPKWERIEEKTICFYSSTTCDTITFRSFNYNGGNYVFNPLDVEGCPSSLKLELEEIKKNFLSMVDLNKIPRVNFGIEKIPVKEESYRFLRIDLSFKSVIWSFIRIEENSRDSHSCIYFGFLDEIADQFLLTGQDIRALVYSKGGGFLSHREESKIEIVGSSSTFSKEENRELTISILREELGYDVC